MDNNENNVTWANIVSRILDGDLLDAIRMIVFVALFMAFPFLLLGIGKVSFDFLTGKIPISSGELENKCFEIKEVAGRTFKLNACTGDHEEIPAIDD